AYLCKRTQNMLPKKTYIIICLLLFSSRLFAQEHSLDTLRKVQKDSLPPADQFVWFTGGIGGAGAGLAALASFSFAKNIHSFSAVYCVSAAYDVGGSGPGGDRQEIGVYYGRQKYSEGVLGRAMIGAAHFTGSHDYGQRINTFALGIQAEVI